MAMSFKQSHLMPVAALMLPALLLYGCDTIHPNGSVDPGFGETARYNAALMIIDPDPRVAENAALPGDNGAVGAGAAKRYRTDTVKKIERVQTSTETTSSGSR